jgi:hypothetical protein
MYPEGRRSYCTKVQTIAPRSSGLRFYLDQLGFRLIVDYNYGERGRFILVAPPNGATLLALIAPKPEGKRMIRSLLLVYDHVA